MIEDNDDRIVTLEKRLNLIAQDIQKNRFMLMEYLGPVVDGCRAAFNVSLERAQVLENITESEFDSYMKTTDDSFDEIGICFKAMDADEEVSMIFSHGKPEVFDECMESTVIISGKLEDLLSVLDSDSKISPVDVLGTALEIKGADSLDVVQGLGLLCYPSLLRLARSGIDPSSVLAEDADSIIMASASDMVAKMIRKWIDLQLQEES